MKRRFGLGRLSAYTLLWALAVVTLYPLIWLLLNSLKASDEMFDRNWALPAAWQWGNYARAWRYGLGHYMVNSVLVTAVSVTLIVLLGALAAFVLTVGRFRGKLALHFFILGGLIVPPEVSLFPLFKIMLTLGIYDTYGAMVLPYLAYGLPFTVLLIRAYMLMIPGEMQEAATIDGAGLVRCFWNVYLPLSRPALAAAALIQGMRVWNEFVFALTFVASDRIRPLTVGLTTFGDSLRTDWAVLMAGLVISILPVLAVFLSMQRQFIGGLTQGALK
jgi:raffinose/stachyose/melibiose transport system permease protein